VPHEPEPITAIRCTGKVMMSGHPPPADRLIA